MCHLKTRLRQDIFTMNKNDLSLRNLIEIRQHQDKYSMRGKYFLSLNACFLFFIILGTIQVMTVSLNCGRDFRPSPIYATYIEQIVLGLAEITNAVLGFIGLWKKKGHKYFLIIGFLVTTTCIFQIIDFLMTTLYYYSEKLIMTYRVERYLNIRYTNYTKNVVFRLKLFQIHRCFSCCGVNGPNETAAKLENHVLPASCCPEYKEKCTPENAYQQGCLKFLLLREQLYYVVQYNTAVTANGIVQFIAMTNILEDSEMEKSEVKDFYENAKVFVTGATGFVGKTLIEKLLRVTEVKTIYILIRPKKGKEVKERIDKMFENPLFELLKSQKSDYREKIWPIIGACEQEGLTISDLDKKELKENVNILFHVAATVNFNEKLRTAYGINVQGTKDILELAHQITNLKAMIYVSTAYSNCIRNTVIEEKVYDYAFDEVLPKIRKITDEKDDSVLKPIIGKWPNTYTFTKAVAETLVKNQRGNLPIGIFRPSIIVSTYKEPIRGWLDNIYATNGICLGVVTGFLRVIPSQSDAIIDMVPVDMCASALIVLAMDVARRKEIRNEDNDDIPVYNYTSGKENPLSIRILNILNFAYGTPSNKAIWFPCTVFVTNEILFWFLTIVLEIIPAMVLDGLTLITGKKPRLLPLYMKVINFMTLIKFFALGEWEFDNTNVQTVWKKLNRTDQELFPFSMSSFSWVIFSRSYLHGISKYLLKQEDSAVPQAVKKFNRFKIMHWILKAVTLYAIFYVIQASILKIISLMW